MFFISKLLLCGCLIFTPHKNHFIHDICEFIMDADFDANVGGGIEGIENLGEIEINSDSTFTLKFIKMLEKERKSSVKK